MPVHFLLNTQGKKHFSKIRWNKNIDVFGRNSVHDIDQGLTFFIYFL